VSSYQLDTGERGFSYRFDAPLDMRMDTRQELTAADIVNDYSESELYRIIRDYGEEKFAKNIAKHIAAARKDKRIETTSQLDEIIHAAIPAKMRTEGHPAKQTFQALRIECNQELKALEKIHNDFIEYAAVMDDEKLALLDEEFHTRIMKMTGNEVMEMINQSVSKRIMNFRYQTFKIKHNVENGIKAHEKILRALMDRDPDVAEVYMKRHIELIDEDMERIIVM
jgi:16S rRNA (cytosine(1402)-N(4))-methyltransferase